MVCLHGKGHAQLSVSHTATRAPQIINPYYQARHRDPVCFCPGGHGMPHHLMSTYQSSIALLCAITPPACAYFVISSAAHLCGTACHISCLERTLIDRHHRRWCTSTQSICNVMLQQSGLERLWEWLLYSTASDEVPKSGQEFLWKLASICSTRLCPAEIAGP